MKRSASIGEILRPLRDAPCQAYINDSLQVADILEWVLAQTGAADVRMTSFSVSEEFLRRIFHIRKEGLVRHLDIVLDFKATNKTLILWPFIAQTVSSCHLANTHSKVLLVSNDSHKVALVTSQNLTRGNRFESGVITTDPEIFAALDADLQYIITRQSVPFHEIYTRTVGRH